MTKKVIPKGIAFLLAISNADTFAILALAIRTPEIGETVRPIDAENSIGKIIEVVLIPNWFVIFGTSGPKAKKAALPLPINTEAKNIITDITILIPVLPKPILCELAIKPSINSKLIKPFEKISAAIINVTTFLKISPIPLKNTCNDSKTNLTFRVLIISVITPAKTQIIITIVVSK